MNKESYFLNLIQANWMSQLRIERISPKKKKKKWNEAFVLISDKIVIAFQFQKFIMRIFILFIFNFQNGNVILNHLSDIVPFLLHFR